MHYLCAQLFLSVFKSVANECPEQKQFSRAVAHAKAAATQGRLLGNHPLHLLWGKELRWCL